MYKTLKVALRRLDFWLRNEPHRNPEVWVTHSIDDLFENPDNPDPWRTRAYWGVRRFWINHWLVNPRDVYWKGVYAYQRLTRGWDDRAVWSIDYWLDDKMPAMLRKLKTDKHGTPMSVFPDDPQYIDEHGNPTEEASEIASKRWDDILDKMIAGFEASRRISDMTYDEELGPYPLGRPKGTPKDEWEKVKHERFVKSEVLRKRDEQIFKEGMALFAEHYWSLWD